MPAGPEPFLFSKIKGDAQSLHRGLRDLNKEYSRKFISLQFGEILRIMGFPQNWDKYMEKI